jgi:hypothetical protein
MSASAESGKKSLISLRHVEKFDQHKLAYIVKNEKKFLKLIKKNRGLNEDEELLVDEKCPMAVAKEMLKQSQNGEVKVHYMQRQPGGRIYALGGCSMQGLTREIRHTIAPDKYVDIDIVNSHYECARFKCKELKIRSEKIDEYCDNREKHLADLKMPRAKAKDLFLAILNGGEAAYKKCENKTEFLQDLRNELIEIRGAISRVNEKEYKKFESKKKACGETFNIQGKYFHNLLDEVENKILMCIYNFYKRPINSVLCHDGIMLPKKGFNKNSLEQCEKIILETVGIQVNLKVKDMDEGFDLDLEYLPDHKDTLIKNPPHEIDPTDNYCWLEFSQEFIDREFASKDEMKMEVIPKMRKVYAIIKIRKGLYVKKDNTEEPFQLVDAGSKGGFDSDMSLKYWGIDDNGKSKLFTISITKFASDNLNWLPAYKSIGPDPKGTKEGNFNTWKGLKARRVDKVDTSKFQMILDHLYQNICDEDDELYDRYLHITQDAIKHPGRLVRNALVICGPGGSGKSTELEFRRDFIFGDGNWLEFDSLETLLNPNNSDQMGVPLLIVEETGVAVGEVKPLMDKNKKLIVGKQRRYADKYVKAIKAENIHFCVFMSNNYDAYPQDRRYLSINATERVLNNKEYFTKLRKKCFNQEAANHYYTWLCDLKFTYKNKDGKEVEYESYDQRSNYQSQTSQLQGDMAKRSHEKFIDELYENLTNDDHTQVKPADEIKGLQINSKLEVQISKLYEYYKKWCEKDNVKVVTLQTIKGMLILHRKMTAGRKSNGVMLHSLAPMFKTDNPKKMFEHYPEVIDTVKVKTDPKSAPLKPLPPTENIKPTKTAKSNDDDETK